MSATIIPLPTADPTYYEILGARAKWRLDIVTPCDGGQPSRTTIARHPSFDKLAEYARWKAAQMRRPLRLPKREAAS